MLGLTNRSLEGDVVWKLRLSDQGFEMVKCSKVETCCGMTSPLKHLPNPSVGGDWLAVTQATLGKNHTSTGPKIGMPIKKSFA
jgi:hypothetical protein